jgi:hypothetical protein
MKKKLEGFDRAALVGLVQNLYAAGKKNQAFLHARFGLGEDVLEPYKKTIDRWLRPDVFRGDISVSKAKQAISDYKKALGDPEGVAELMVFYCESAAGFYLINLSSFFKLIHSRGPCYFALLQPARIPPWVSFR